MNKFICWLTGLPETNTVSNGTKFVITQGSSALVVTWENILKSINILTVPAETHNIVEVGADYTLDGSEDIVICHGTLAITYENKVNSEKSHSIRAIGGTVTISSDALIEETSILTDGQAVKAVYSAIADSWVDL